jgi:putative endonuclease
VPAYWVYVARCADDTLYCGIAIDVAARIAQHDAGTGARYTRGRGPLEVVYRRRCATKGLALRLEHAIKQLSRPDKARLLAEPKRIANLVRQLKRRMTSQVGSRVKVAVTSRSG